MNEIAYPALYHAADEASGHAQRTYLNLVRLHFALLIGSAGLSVYGIEDAWAAAVAAILIFASIAVSFVMLFARKEDSWYRARAVAESVKTSAWRYMMAAEPYAGDDGTAMSLLRQRVRQMLSEHRTLAHELRAAAAEKEQITDVMSRARKLTWQERRDYYSRFRVEDQRAWYISRGETHRRNARNWFVVLLACQCCAVVLVVLRVALPSWRYWPVEVLVVAAGAALTWTQVNKFRELAAAYALTAHEVSLIAGELKLVRDESEFLLFVIDSENAFSREHTQWLARKDRE